MSKSNSPAEGNGGSLFSPKEWAQKLGNFKPRDKRLPQAVDIFSAEHAAASFLHGWDVHEYHYQSEPLKLTQKDYELALEAAGKYPCSPPHAPALSKAVAKKFENFKPKTAANKAEKES